MTLEAKILILLRARLQGELTEATTSAICGWFADVRREDVLAALASLTARGALKRREQDIAAQLASARVKRGGFDVPDQAKIVLVIYSLPDPLGQETT